MYMFVSLYVYVHVKGGIIEKVAAKQEVGGGKEGKDKAVCMRDG